MGHPTLCGREKISNPEPGRNPGKSHESESVPIGTADYLRVQATTLNPKCPLGIAKPSLRKNRFALHGKVHRTSNKTLRVSGMVQRMCLGLVATRRQADLRSQDHFDELTPAVG
jgi:hypothetical protein